MGEAGGRGTKHMPLLCWKGWLCLFVWLLFLWWWRLMKGQLIVLVICSYPKHILSTSDLTELARG